MCRDEVVPAYYDGQDRRTSPVFHESRKTIKAKRKAGELNGWYQENGRVFILYRPPAVERDHMSVSAGSGFDSAWAVKPSAGFLVWQLKTCG